MHHQLSDKVLTGRASEVEIKFTTKNASTEIALTPSPPGGVVESAISSSVKTKSFASPVDKRNNRLQCTQCDTYECGDDVNCLGFSIKME